MVASPPFTGTTLSTTTTYDLPSPHVTAPRFSDDDDDEIVWSVSESSMSFKLKGVIVEDCAVTKPLSGLSTLVGYDELLEHQTPVAATEPLEMQMNTQAPTKKKAKKSKRCKKKAKPSIAQDTITTSDQRNSKSSTGFGGNAYPSPAQSPKRHVDIVPLSRKNPQESIPAQVVSAMENLGLGQRPIVDDISVISGDKTPTAYEEASSYISAFLSNPDAQTDWVCRLTLLQSLIIELGLATSSALPSTLSAAKAFLKAHAFLNIREYIAVRGEGPEAVQSVMYPSRSALIKSIKKKRNATSIKWVKELGLQALLVGYMH